MQPQPYFSDRRDAGRMLADTLLEYAGRDDVIVLALPRGGVPVAYEVAQRLRLRLDLFLVRKLGAPGHPELAMGAIASGGVRLLNHDVVTHLHVSPEQIDRTTRAETEELERRAVAYRDERPYPDLQGCTVLLVDDGLATGFSMRAAIEALRMKNPREIIVAVPTASPDTCREFETVADGVVCAVTPEPFLAVGIWYEDFSQTTDDEVRELLRQAWGARQNT